MALVSTAESSNTLSEEAKDARTLEILYSLETHGIKSSKLNNQNDLVLEKFHQTVRFENGRFVVRWPWKVQNLKLPTHFRMCMARLQSFSLC